TPRSRTRRSSGRRSHVWRSRVWRTQGSVGTCAPRPAASRWRGRPNSVQSWGPVWLRVKTGEGRPARGCLRRADLRRRSRGARGRGRGGGLAPRACRIRFDSFVVGGVGVVFAWNRPAPEPDTLLAVNQAASRSRFLESGSVLLVGAAAALWAFDAYFRPGLTRQLSSGQIVLVEDLLISLGLVPVILLNLGELRRLSGRRWLALFAIAFGPQAIATVLFTRAIGFSFANPAAPNFDVLHEVYLLYILQPVFGVVFARIFLGEKRKRSFWPLAALALVGVYLIVFAEDPTAPWQIRHPELLAGAFVLGAVVMWAGGT